MADLKITDDMRDILNRSTIKENTLTLPEQLTPNDYKKINTIITAAGGKWSKKNKCHEFTSDPAAIFGVMAQDKVIDKKKLYQAFYTPEELAELMANVANVKGCNVLEPSAGGGALVKAALAAGASSVTAMDINPEAVADLRKWHPCLEQDFMKWVAVPVFKRVLMNPPFTKDQDVAHVIRAVRCLDEGGVLVAVMGGNTTRDKFQRLLRNLETMGEVAVQQLPAGTFKESGTGVATVLLKFTLHRASK